MLPGPTPPELLRLPSDSTGTVFPPASSDLGFEPLNLTNENHPEIGVEKKGADFVHIGRGVNLVCSEPMQLFALCEVQQHVRWQGWRASDGDSDVRNLLWFPDWVALFISHGARNMPQQ